jgi:hypothetical protein
MKVTRGSGITSCLMVRFSDFFQYWNNNNAMPETIDSTEQFSRYRDVDTQDISTLIFKPYVKQEHIKISDFYHEWQYKWYNEMPLGELSEAYKVINPFSDEIVNRAAEIRQMIGDRTVILYRGNDKAFEIFRTPYFCMHEMGIETKTSSFFVQTDEIEFYDYWKQNFNDSIWYEKLPQIHKNPDAFFIPEKGQRIEFTLNFIATLLAISTANKIVMTTGNVGLTVALMRGTTNGVWQFHGTHRMGRRL